MPKCSACGCYMEGHFGVCAACKNAREFQKGQESIQQATEDAARVTRAAALLAHASHEQSMQAEAKRLEELQKQTQIMLEGQISNEEAYQSGYDLEEDLLDLSLTEGGELHWDISAPYLVARLNVAYAKGTQDRLEKEFPSELPGVEYMRQEAFGHGYAGSNNCSIVYLHHIPSLFPATLRIPSETGMVENINQETGMVERQWMPVYISVELNNAYDAGVQKYLDEQNVAELLAERLEKTRRDKKQIEESLINRAHENLIKNQNEQRGRKKKLYVVVVILVLGVIGGFGYWIYMERSGSYKALRQDLLGSGWKILPIRDKNLGKGEVQYCTEDLLCSVEFISPKNSKMIKVVWYRVCSSVINNCYGAGKPDGFEKVETVVDLPLKVANKNFKDMKSGYEK